MATVLRRLKITKVDLCPAGADPDADVMLFKSRDHDRVAKRNIPASHRHTMPRGNFAGPHESYPIEKPEDVKNAWDLAGHAKNPNAVRARIKRIAHAKGAAFVAALPDTAKVTKEDTEVPKTKLEKIDITKATDEEVAEYVAELEKALEEQEKVAVGKAKKKPVPPKSDDDEDDEDMEKELPERVRKTLEEADRRVADAERRATEAVQKADAATERITKAEERAEIATIEKSVERDMSKVPGTTAEVAKMLFEAKHKISAESYTVLEKALKAGSEAIAKASEEVGSSRGPAVGSAEARLMAKAEVLEKELKISHSEAVVKASKDDPELYREYQKERGLGPKTR